MPPARVAPLRGARTIYSGKGTIKTNNPEDDPDFVPEMPRPELQAPLPLAFVASQPLLIVSTSAKTRREGGSGEGELVEVDASMTHVVPIFDAVDSSGGSPAGGRRQSMDSSSSTRRQSMESVRSRDSGEAPAASPAAADAPAAEPPPAPPLLSLSFDRCSQLALPRSYFAWLQPAQRAKMTDQVTLL